MNQLHENLLYVKSLVTAMGNLNKQEAQLQGAGAVKDSAACEEREGRNDRIVDRDLLWSVFH